MQTSFVLCIQNETHLASLELFKVYQAIVDSKAASHSMIRIIDESGEDFLYPERYFEKITLPEKIERLFIKSTEKI